MDRSKPLLYALLVGVALANCASVAWLSAPENFCVSLYSTGFHLPRSFIVLPNEDIIALDAFSGQIFLLYDENLDFQSMPNESVVLVPRAPEPLNHGLAYSQGYLYASSATSVFRWAYHVGQRRINNRVEVVVQDIRGGPSHLAAPGSTWPDGVGGHHTRTLAIQGDTLYVQVGSKADIDLNPGRSQIRGFNLQQIPSEQGFDFLDGFVFAEGLRDATVLAFDANEGLWATDNSIDRLPLRQDFNNADISATNPADEINRLVNTGNDTRFFGYPYCWTEFEMTELPSLSRGIGTQWGQVSDFDEFCRAEGNIPPAISLPAHSMPMGMVFYPRQDAEFPFPPDMHNGLFVALHGTLAPRVMYYPFAEDGVPTQHDSILLHSVNNQIQFRPFGVGVGPSGVLYVSGCHTTSTQLDCTADDNNGVILAVKYINTSLIPADLPDDVEEEVTIPSSIVCPPEETCRPECHFHGRCVNNTCHCHNGWKGDACERPICDKCVHGACSPDGEHCCCSVGWMGDACDIFVGPQPTTGPVCSLDDICVCPATQKQIAAGEAFANVTECGKDTYLPDLIPLPMGIKPYIEWTAFQPCDCVYKDTCINGTGFRKLLKFESKCGNVGSADLFIGNPTDYAASGHYIWHTCHNHPHFKHWAVFRLIEKTTGRTILSAKSSSAVIDSTSMGLRNMRARPPTYSNSKQGLSVGYADWYPPWWPCQWIDVTDLPKGTYDLEVEYNPLRVIRESNYENNKLVIPMNCSKPCVYGYCDFGVRCVCDQGYSGESCEIFLAGNCTPNCDGKSCGSDGCDGRCGTCSSEETCSPDGNCQCTPQCAGKECGDDKCRLPNGCGYCYGTDKCSADGQCQCTPNCTNRECGWDGCCGWCGDCSAGKSCLPKEGICAELSTTASPFELPEGDLLTTPRPPRPTGADDLTLAPTSVIPEEDGTDVDSEFFNQPNSSRPDPGLLDVLNKSTADAAIGGQGSRSPTSPAEIGTDTEAGPTVPTLPSKRTPAPTPSVETPTNTNTDSPTAAVNDQPTASARGSPTPTPTEEKTAPVGPREVSGLACYNRGGRALCPATFSCILDCSICTATPYLNQTSHVCQAPGAGLCQSNFYCDALKTCFDSFNCSRCPGKPRANKPTHTCEAAFPLSLDVLVPILKPLLPAVLSLSLSLLILLSCVIYQCVTGRTFRNSVTVVGLVLEISDITFQFLVYFLLLRKESTAELFLQPYLSLIIVGSVLTFVILILHLRALWFYHRRYLKYDSFSNTKQEAAAKKRRGGSISTRDAVVAAVMGTSKMNRVDRHVYIALLVSFFVHSVPALVINFFIYQDPHISVSTKVATHPTAWLVLASLAATGLAVPFRIAMGLCRIKDKKNSDVDNANVELQNLNFADDDEEQDEEQESVPSKINGGVDLGHILEKTRKKEKNEQSSSDQDDPKDHRETKRGQGAGLIKGGKKKTEKKPSSEEE